MATGMVKSNRFRLCPNVLGVFGQKAGFRKRYLEWRFFKTADFLFSYRWTKTEVYEYRDFVHHTAHAPERNAIVFPSFQRFNMNGAKYFEYMLLVDAFCFEKGEKISLKKKVNAWTRP